jgi:subtilisin family serine protease
VRRMTALAGCAAIALAIIVPLNQAKAQTELPGDPAAPGSKAVVESDTGSYIVVMRADPLITTISPDALNTPAANAQGAALEASHDAVLAESGVSTSAKVQDYTNALNGFSATLSYRQAVTLAANTKVSMVLPDELRQVDSTDGADGAGQGNPGGHGSWDGDGDDDDDDGHGGHPGTAPDDLGNFLGLTGRGRAWSSGLTGEGVVIGVIDTGIWPEHPSFRDDGTYPAHAPLADKLKNGKPSNPCDFGNTAANPNDAPFTCNNKLIGAREILSTYRNLIGADPDEFDSARDDDGHGTHTASTAAGDANVQARIFGRPVGKISGIAPRAQIIAYKALGNLGGFTSDLAAAIDQAVADGVDVINYSIGGGASLISGDDLAFLFAADAGVFTAVSAGNSGAGPATIGGPADVPWVTSVGANTQRRFFQGTVKLKGGPKINGASVSRGTNGVLPLVDAEFVGTSDLCLEGSLDPTKVAGKIVLCRRGGNGRVAKSKAVFDAGGKGIILYNTSDVDDLFSDNFWVPGIAVDYSDGITIKNYIASKDKPRAKIGFDKTTQIDFAPSMTLFSSRGPDPTASDIIKPDVTAPGLQILAGDSPFPNPDEVQGELFMAIGGTSMSSPVTAGMYALLKQAHPDWTPAMAKSALMGTANTNVLNNDRVSPAGPFDMGAGMVNPGKVTARGSAFNPGLVYNAGIFDYFGFLCDTAPEVFSNPTATCGTMSGHGIPTTAENLNYPSIAIGELAGSETITRTVTSVANTTTTFTAAVNAPAGYTVTVDPSTITLAPGATATFQITFTNVGAPNGEWRFGDLTWEGGGYHVRSPIAVKGVQLVAPAAISGTGTDGSTSFDVKFGYDGAYAADAHGLVAATATPGTVLQDHDQTFPSADDNQGGVVMIPYPVSGAAAARWSLHLPGPDDLDLYLLDSGGNIVAQSTNGGTDEDITLIAPADDTYTLAVHGWAVGEAAGLNFSVQSWIVPNATGGSLSIAAPTAAVLGTTATETASWTGLAAGNTYLGAITHSDSSGVLATTLVDVTT